jgi:hypothetical protein
MATIVDVTGATYPKEYNGNTILPREGESLVPSFASAYGRRAPLFWEHEGNAAVRICSARRRPPGTWLCRLPHTEAASPRMCPLPITRRLCGRLPAVSQRSK